MAGVTRERIAQLQRVGLWSGFAAGAWLGAAEAPTKLVTLGLSPVIISLIMVLGVFLARWSVPALLHGTTAIRFDVKQAPHLIIWAIIAGALWAVANTLTVFAIRDVGLSIAFPLWNSNSLLGVLWGALFFRELHGASRKRVLGVVIGALVMVIGGTVLGMTSLTLRSAPNAVRGIIAALTAGLMWGTMYIPYRKAYLTGMSPLSFITFFSIGEVVTMLMLGLWFSHGVSGLTHDLVAAKGVAFWIMLGGFVWVVGDLFQQYAAKYVGISRGIPLSNTNQLWGLLWGVLVFGELHGSGTVLQRVIIGSLLMAAGAAAIAFATADPAEHAQWQRAAEDESARYSVDPAFVEARMSGEAYTRAPRTWIDYTIAAVATLVFVYFATLAEAPKLDMNIGAALLVVIATFVMLVVAGVKLWRTTRFV
ncbi:MAG TPA: GRP family sugar transporter [Longimicrobiales bacterium]|nr:GRP family sugar transporter [Longimicrobiales bacterium]